MKLIGMEIVSDAPVQTTKKKDYLCTTVKLVYKKTGLFNKGLKYETAFPSGSYRTRSDNNQFLFFSFVNEVGEEYNDEICNKITAFLEKEKHLGNLKLKE